MVSCPIYHTRVHYFELEGEYTVKEPFAGGGRGDPIEDGEKVCKFC
jgi:hypothetical protein